MVRCVCADLTVALFCTFLYNPALAVPLPMTVEYRRNNITIGVITMSFSAVNTADIIKKHQRNGENDTGSPEVQVALLSARIERLTEHFKTHKHDNGSRRGLLRLVSQRRKLLRYLAANDSVRYRALLSVLGLRG